MAESWKEMVQKSDAASLCPEAASRLLEENDQEAPVPQMPKAPLMPQEGKDG